MTEERSHLSDLVPGGDLLRFVPNIKNGVEIKFHCDSDSLGQMWLIGIGH